MAISDLIRSSKTDRPERKKKIHRALVRRRTKDGTISVVEPTPFASVTKKVYLEKTSSVESPFPTTVRVVRLSDPNLAGQVEKLSERIKSDPEFAMKLLRKAGIADASGKLSQRYGG